MGLRRRVQGGFWRALEAVGVKNARSALGSTVAAPAAGRASSRDRAARARARVGGGGAAASDAARSPRRSCTSSTCCRPRARRIALPLTVLGVAHRLPDPVGERAERDESPVRDPGLQGVPEHGHDGRDRDLRDDGDRAEHGGRLRGPARSRVRRLLCDRRLHRGLVRVSALQLGRLRVRRGRRPAGRQRIPHLDLARPHHRRRHHRRCRSAHRLAHAPAAGRLPRHRDARLRRDHPPGRPERRRRRDQRSPRHEDRLQPHERRVRHQPGRPARLRRLVVRQARAAGGLHRRERLVRELREPRLLVGDRAPADHDLLQPPAARLAAGPRVDRDPRGRDCRRRDGDPADADEDLGLCERRVLRRRRRSLVRLVQAGRVSGRLPLQLLDLHPLHGHPRRDGQRVGRHRRCRLPHVPRQGGALERGRVVQRAGLRRLRLRPGRAGPVEADQCRLPQCAAARDRHLRNDPRPGDALPAAGPDTRGAAQARDRGGRPRRAADGRPPRAGGRTG